MTDQIDSAVVSADEQSTQPTANLTLDQALDALKKARQEAASYRVKKNEFSEQNQKLQEQVQEFTSKLNIYSDYDSVKTNLQKLQEENKTLKLKMQLNGKVIDVDKALRLVDETYLTENGEGLDVDKFLSENQFLAVQKSENSIKNPAVNKTPIKSTEPTVDELKGLPQKDLVKFFEDRFKKR